MPNTRTVAEPRLGAMPSEVSLGSCVEGTTGANHGSWNHDHDHCRRDHRLCFICYHERFIFDFRVIERIPMAESMIDDLVSGGVVEIRRQI